MLHQMQALAQKQVVNIHFQTILLIVIFLDVFILIFCLFFSELINMHHIYNLQHFSYASFLQTNCKWNGPMNDALFGNFDTPRITIHTTNCKCSINFTRFISH